MIVRVEEDGLVAALVARDMGLQLAHAVVHDHRLVSETEAPPTFFGQFMVRLTFGLQLLDVRLLDDLVQVLVQAIQQSHHELLGILLLVAAELGLPS